jgi:tetratricopeptide (TPR) repeat protein
MKKKDQAVYVNPRLIRPHGWSPVLHVDLAKMPDQQRQTFVLHRLAGFTGAGYPAERCYHFYTNKQAEPLPFPDYVWTPWSRDTAAAEPAKIDALQEVMPYVPDEDIAEVCRSLVTERQLLDDINGELGLALADFLGLPAPRTDQDFEELSRHVNDYRRTHGPAWASQATIRPLIDQLKDVFLELKSLEFELMASLQPYFERVRPRPGEMADQRADDLVNEAREEPDADRAISLLKKALRYGKTGIQASSAYMELGARYSDQGQAKKAIAYYTKSIEASEIPNAYALYWRGELYYQQEEWDKALGDFERAVSIGLYSPEYEQAQEYLSELRARQPGE